MSELLRSVAHDEIVLIDGTRIVTNESYNEYGACDGCSLLVAYDSLEPVTPEVSQLRDALAAEKQHSAVLAGELELSINENIRLNNMITSEREERRDKSATLQAESAGYQDDNVALYALVNAHQETITAQEKEIKQLLFENAQLQRQTIIYGE